MDLKKIILKNLNNPDELEKIYQSNRLTFKNEFLSLSSKVKDKKIYNYWKARLNYTNSGFSIGSRKELMVIFLCSLFAVIIANLPEIFSIDEEFFYTRNISFIVFSPLAIYFIWKKRTNIRKILIILIVIFSSILYINFLPNHPLNKESDTLILACLHLPVFLWTTFSLLFFGKNITSHKERLSFIKYNGDLVVISGLILLGGGIFSGITVGLFELINIDIEEFYFRYIVITGLASLPIIGTHIIDKNPNIVDKISPLIAKLFSPIVLITLSIYIGSIIFFGSNIYNNREFLLLFNIVLIGVMALIFFSITEGLSTSMNKIEIGVLFLLSLVTILVNGIALSAILIRIMEWGITPNRTAVLGSNILILTNLIVVSSKLYYTLMYDSKPMKVGISIVVFMSIYYLWSLFVTFLFPLIFNFN
ncbi:uncharacterized protein METZ01_LOCUS43086 [marine metagenome]|uniref:DUF4153 domain-containing protein n=1 Tax=marine metagenome TaxID=408172 RepID=A0A381REM3_9ZZZZ